MTCLCLSLCVCSLDGMRRWRGKESKLVSYICMYELNNFTIGNKVKCHVLILMWENIWRKKRREVLHLHLEKVEGKIYEKRMKCPRWYLLFFDLFFFFFSTHLIISPLSENVQCSPLKKSTYLCMYSCTFGLVVCTACVQCLGKLSSKS